VIGAIHHYNHQRVDMFRRLLIEAGLLIEARGSVDIERGRQKLGEPRTPLGDRLRAKICESVRARRAYEAAEMTTDKPQAVADPEPNDSDLDALLAAIDQYWQSHAVPIDLDTVPADRHHWVRANLQTYQDHLEDIKIRLQRIKRDRDRFYRRLATVTAKQK
jgi:hypothetical protein